VLQRQSQDCPARSTLLSDVALTELVASFVHLPVGSSTSFKLASQSEEYVTCFSVRQLAYSAGPSQPRLCARQGFFWPSMIAPSAGEPYFAVDME
jgi:hypothetical protein